jgi:hypothetical protein
MMEYVNILNTVEDIKIQTKGYPVTKSECVKLGNIIEKHVGNRNFPETNINFAKIKKKERDENKILRV